MIFYDISPSLVARMENVQIRPFVRIAFDFVGDGNFTFISDTDILECAVTEYIETTGGIVHNGNLILDNEGGQYTPATNAQYLPKMQVRVVYCLGDSHFSFTRFTLYVDNLGFQCVGTETGEKICKVGLVDLSFYLKQTDKERDWKSVFTAVHSVVCDKSTPDNSLVHLIAKRAGLGVSDIDCGYLPFGIPYVQITENVWSELSALARAYKAHLECGGTLPLTFAYSRYDALSEFAEPKSSYTLHENAVIYFRRFDTIDEYKNTVRLKWNRCVVTARTVLWRYTDRPVWFDESLQPHYPFANESRDIEKYEMYEAAYSVIDTDGKKRQVVYSHEVDTLETFTTHLTTLRGTISIVKYDTQVSRTFAQVQLAASEGAVLSDCYITGKAIAIEPNFCHFIGNENAVADEGVKAINITNKYLSETLLHGLPFYALWAHDTLSDVSKKRRGYFVKTNKALFNARCGAYLSLDLQEVNGIFEEKAKITELSLRYKKKAAFETTFWLSSN